MIFLRENLNAEYNICPTLENRRMQRGKDIPAKSRVPSQGIRDCDTRDRQFDIDAITISVGSPARVTSSP